MRRFAGLLASILAQNADTLEESSSNIDFNDIVLSKTTAAHLESTGFDLTGLSIVKDEDIHPDYRGQTQDSENRGLGTRGMWEPLHPLGRIVIPFFVDNSFASGRSEINRAMEHLEKVLGCFEFRNVESSAGSHKYPSGGIVFKQNPVAQGCFSSIGVSPGYHIANLNVPQKWQAIVMGNNCYGYDYGASQHEMLHALGVWHEQQRPDYDNYIDIDKNHPDYSSQWDTLKIEKWYDVNSIYEPWSLMHYPLNGAPATLKNGNHTFPAKRITTTDALQIQTMYCKNQPDKFPKWNNTKTAQCTKEDLSGVIRPVFGTYLCDGTNDCPDGEDEEDEQCLEWKRCPMSTEVRIYRSKIYDDNGEYTRYPIYLPWGEARSFCEERNLTLLTIPYQYEFNDKDNDDGYYDWDDIRQKLYNSFKRNLEGYNHRVWVGHYREQHASGNWNENWRSVVGTKGSMDDEDRLRFLKNNWFKPTNEPNNFGATAEECVNMALYKRKEDGIYNDDVCSKYFPFICEVPDAMKNSYYVRKNEKCKDTVITHYRTPWVPNNQASGSAPRLAQEEEEKEDDEFMNDIHLLNNTEFQEKYENYRQINDFENQKNNFEDYFNAVFANLKNRKKVKTFKNRIFNLLTSLRADFTFYSECKAPLFPDYYRKTDFRNWYFGNPHFFDVNDESFDKCYFLEHISEAVLHFTHNFACEGDFRRLKRKKKNLIYRYCPHRFRESLFTYF